MAKGTGSFPNEKCFAFKSRQSKSSSAFLEILPLAFFQIGRGINCATVRRNDRVGLPAAIGPTRKSVIAFVQPLRSGRANRVRRTNSARDRKRRDDGLSVEGKLQTNRFAVQSQRDEHRCVGVFHPINRTVSTSQI